MTEIITFPIISPVSGSVFFWPGGSGGFKAGVYVGSPGAGVLLEGYTRIWDCKEGWIPDIRSFVNNTAYEIGRSMQELENQLMNWMWNMQFGIMGP